MGAKLLQDVRQDLADVVQVCEGKKKQTNYLRTLINELVKGAPVVPLGCRGSPGSPSEWRRVPAGPRPDFPQGSSMPAPGSRLRNAREFVSILCWFTEH